VSQDLTDAYINAPVRTLADEQDVAVQLLEQSPIAFDTIIFRDLIAAHSAEVNGRVLAGCGTKGQVLGVHSTAGTRRTSQAKQARAAQVAARIVATHGNTITVEDCRISTWTRLWGKRIALFSPGMLVKALDHECHATGGQFYRAGTHTTAMSQHCLCGARVAKTLNQRTHHCGHCGLHGDRDIVSAALAACVELANPDGPRTAAVDYRLAHALRDGLASQQEWEGSVNRHQSPPSPDGGSARTGSHHHPAAASAEQAALGLPPNRPRQQRGRRGNSQKTVPKLSGAA
jgi:Putative transposase DNA-binding domain